MAFGTELDLGGLDTSGKEFYLTRTVGSERGLSVHKRGDGLERHRLGFWQPHAASQEVRPVVIDLALVPGLVFDEAGNRLGYGLGYYDRLLPQLRPGALIVGVTVNALVVPSLPNEALDVPVTHLLTESGVRKARH
jgi:5-formyltetrahydrofolate cyclo-ligase